MTVYADRVKETTTTTGTGVYSLDGAPAGYRTFLSAVSSGSEVTYCVEDGTSWEIGEGVVTTGTPATLTRAVILASSNAGAAVSWGAGSKNVFLTLSGARVVTTDKNSTITGALTASSFVGPLTGNASTASALQTARNINGVAFNGSANINVPNLLGSNGTLVVASTGVSSAVSHITISNATAGNAPRISTNTANTYIQMWATGDGYVELGANNRSVVYVGSEASVSSYLDVFATSSSLRLDANAAQGFGTFTFTTNDTTASSGYFRFAVDGGLSLRDIFRASPSVNPTTTQNYINVYSNNAGAAPSLEAEGGDANINLDIWGKGTGSIRLNGNATTISSVGELTSTLTISSTRGFASAEFNAGSGAPGTINWNNGQNQVRTLTSSGSLTLSNPVSGSTYKLRIVQGGAGSFTITWPTIKWAGGTAPALTTAAGGEDVITLYYNGTSYYGQAATGFA